MAWQGKKPSDFTKAVVKNVEKTMEEVAVMLDRSLVLKTPVNEGRARSNWIVTAGSPSEEENDSFDQAGSASVQSANNFTAKIGQPFFINNNVPYIGYLNNGTPNMQAFHMVERSIKQVQRALK